MIRINELTKSYGPRVLLDSINLIINPGEKIGLIGRNGHGKTTLFKLILDFEEYDSGSISVPEDYQIGHLSQHIEFTHATTLEECCSILPILEGGWKETFKAEAALSGLGFTQEQFQLPPEQLSSGYQLRLNLAKVLVSEPNLLLLDEPTNYLDIVSMRWLGQFLKGWKGEIMLISHDRDFMNSLSTHTVAIHRKKLRKAPGNTQKLREQIALEEESHEKTRTNQEKKRKHAEDFIRKFRTKASRASLVQSRVKALEKEGVLNQLERIEDLYFRFNAAPIESKYILQTRHLNFGYEPEDILIDDLSFSVKKTDRIGIIGKNGKGKSTCLSLLTKNLTPLKGDVSHSLNLQISHFGQSRLNELHPDNTVEQELMSVSSLNNRTQARSLCGLMMFSGDDALKEIKVLSGGEKARVLLGKVLAEPANLLLLDEPTNHLDQESTVAFMEAIAEFSGAVMLVTHSEMLLRKVATRLIVFDNNTVTIFEGNYDEFLQKIGWQDEQDSEKTIQVSASNKKELRKKRADILSRWNKLIAPLKKGVEELEGQIIELEEKLETENTELLEITKDGFNDDAAKLSRIVSNRKKEIDDLFEAFEVKSEQLAEYDSGLQKDLNKLQS